MQNETTSNLIEEASSPDGIRYGQAATSLVGFYGAAPVVQRSAAIQGAITDSSGGTANLDTGVAALTGSYNSAILSNALATALAQVEEIRASLVAMGLLKGSA